MSRDENAMAASQAELNEANKVLLELVEQYKQGLTSIVEFVDSVAFQKRRVSNINLAGLTDPNSGLPYPTLEEIEAFEARFNAIPVSHIGA